MLNNAQLSELCTMHTYCRPMGSVGEAAFIDRYLLDLPGAKFDAHGNLHVIVGDADPFVVFSSHTDTVHRGDDDRQRVQLSSKGVLSVITPQHHADRRWFDRNKFARRPDCLGADDTAGVFIMRQMILARVAGHYIFHYGEEKGGIGSEALAKHNPEKLKGRTIAIAFDRAGYADVITHQRYDRGCSDAFAWSLCEALDLNYQPCDRGVYTDTAEYFDLIPECTNISVGYANAHSPRETLDTIHIGNLLDRLLHLDWSALTIDRDPNEKLVRPFAVYTFDNSARTYLGSWECELCGRWNRSYMESCTCCRATRDESDLYKRLRESNSEFLRTIDTRTF